MAPEQWRGRQLGGATDVWALGLLLADRCKLLHSVWDTVPVEWEDGRPVLRQAPAGHPCGVGVPPVPAAARRTPGPGAG